MIDTHREQACAPLPTPAGIAGQLGGYAWARSTVGESGGAVYRLHGKAGAPDLYLKHGKGAVADDISDEMTRLRWLAGHLPAPGVLHFSRTLDEAWLLMSAMPGKTAYQLLDTHPALQHEVVDALAAFLRRLHAIPLHTCPFTSGHAYRLALAWERIDAGLVDEDDFDEERQGWTAGQVWDALQAMLPLAADPVVTHGDFSLDNLFIQEGVVTGCIDVGRVGIADRYQDLAIMWNCLGEFGVPLQERFLNHYGFPDPDRNKLRFHLLLDELF
ncbi:APH(3')-I family aminoglycoside O-phosphotransferase [Massilia sp. Mn16-1_5]|uniref:APH(3')-I family aminoglycoside O-phosphotransferase n=1 Tax=Massilia sp. Mn16-1_5 TaxID=2079199 RepID=UPI00109E8BC6|nr:APH(3')-I family aminoglycoside O-phosphotransferase [Massilia sp. Mn16-1_5]THC44487.1 APH(3')-I family aminoglycoside O-phosphotransferase [Massilia sp. Mn16-1_5]